MMRLLAVSIASLLAACQPANDVEVSPAPAPAPPQSDPVQTALTDRYLAINVRPTDPIEALEWAQVRCEFLGGELSGDNRAQDRAIIARMNELGCGDPIMAAARDLRTAKASDADAVARLDALLARHEY